MTLKEEIAQTLKDNIYDDHEDCDDSCGKTADYTEMVDEILEAVRKIVPEKLPASAAKLSEHSLLQRQGFNQAIEIMEEQL